MLSIRSLFVKALPFLQTITWSWSAKKAIVLGYGELSIDDIAGKNLFVIPHADDELLPSYQLLQKTKQDAIVYYCGMTGSNDTPENKRIRDSEIKQFCESSSLLLLYPDDWKHELVETIKTYNVKNIFFPSYIDWHPEHRLIGEEILKHESDIPLEIRLFWYSVSVPIVHKRSKLVPLTKTTQVMKYSAFRNYYRSQKNMPIKRLMIQEKVNARNSSSFAAEVFLSVSFDDIKHIMENTDTNELNKLKNEVNHISGIRYKAARQYSLLN